MKKAGQGLSKEELRKYVGHVSQLAGTKRYVLQEGKAQSLEAIDVKTGSGLYYTVLPGRGMDIAHMEFKGFPMAHIAKPGLVNATYYTHGGFEWLRSFSCGLLTTCGLTHVGGNEQDGIYETGLHGRISNIPAEEVIAQTEWNSHLPVMRVSGKTREAAIFGENLVIAREITSKYGESKLQIQDTITNEGFAKSPLMLLYHINIGYPVLSENSKLYINSQHVQGRDKDAQNDLSRYADFQKPTAGYAEQVFFHKVKADANGNTAVAVVNETLNIGVYVKYSVLELPCFTEWKMMGEQDYVLGIEPGNCIPQGKRLAEEKGALCYLDAGESVQTHLEIGVLDGVGAIRRFKEKWSNDV